MSTDKTGGPAFPTHTLDVPFKEASDPKHKGMTLLDWFAGQAIGLALRAGGEVTKPEVAASSGAKLAYIVAAAMLAEREKYR